MDEPLPPIQDDNNIQTQPGHMPYDWVITLFNGLGNVLTRVGITGFVVLSVVIFILFFVNKNQQAEIVNTWILFKGNDAPACIIIFVLCLILFFQQYHYKRVIHTRDERINELAGKKNSAYSKKLNVDLATSVTRKRIKKN